jgi:ribonuclease Y
MNYVLLIEGVAVLFLGAALGYVARHYVALYRRGSVEQEIQEKLLAAKKEALKIEDEAVSRAKEEKEYLAKLEDRLSKKEEDLDKKEKDFRRDVETLQEKAEALKQIKEALEVKEKDLGKKVEDIANLTQAEAKEIVIKNITKAHEEDLRLRMLKLSRDGETLLAEKAKDILVNSVYRIANGNISNFFSSTVEIEDEERITQQADFWNNSKQAEAILKNIRARKYGLTPMRR